MLFKFFPYFLDSLRGTAPRFGVESPNRRIKSFHTIKILSFFMIEDKVFLIKVALLFDKKDSRREVEIDIT